MNETPQIAPRYDAYPFDGMVILRLIAVGMVTGVVGWLLYMAITEYFIVPVFCRSADAFAVCNNGGTIAWISAHIIALVAAVAVLARMAVYRPLLVVVAVLAALWSAHAWLGVLPWYQAISWQAILFALAFALFGWVARTVTFVPALVGLVVLVVTARLVLLWA